MDRNVFFSLLALDAYNRGYGAGIDGLDESGELGTATIRAFGLDEQQGWESSGFYAIAYNWNGETIISFRGTNCSDSAYPRHCEATQSPWQSRAAPREALDCFAFGSQ